MSQLLPVKLLRRPITIKQVVVLIGVCRVNAPLR